jgi:cyclophilin family peptidyl-prolyl cis-trans isomerase
VRAVRRALTVVLLSLLALAAGCGSEDGGEGGGGSSSGGDLGSPRTETSRTETERAGGGCEQVDAPEPKPDGGAQPPKDALDPKATYDVVVATNCGDFTIRLDQQAAPETAASVAELARSGFYDGTIFHRVVSGFVIQGGDPTGTGSGGPGYSTRDKPPADATYTRGVVAMAKTGAEAPGTAGSQFYVVTGEDAGLPPEYAIVGEVREGLETTAAIDALGDPAVGDGPPRQPVVIESAKVVER